jgi:hypothetical protein
MAESSGCPIGLCCEARVPTQAQEFQINTKPSQKKKQTNPDYLYPAAVSRVACTQEVLPVAVFISFSISLAFPPLTLVMFLSRFNNETVGLLLRGVE